MSHYYSFWTPLDAQYRLENLVFYTLKRIFFKRVSSWSSSRGQPEPFPKYLMGEGSASSPLPTFFYFLMTVDRRIESGRVEKYSGAWHSCATQVHSACKSHNGASRFGIHIG